MQAAHADSNFYDSDYDYGGLSSLEPMTLDRVTFRNLKHVFALGANDSVLASNCTFAGNEVDISVYRDSSYYTNTKVANLSVVPVQRGQTAQEARARVMPLAQAPLNKFLQANDTAFAKLRKVLHKSISYVQICSCALL